MMFWAPMVVCHHTGNEYLSDLAEQELERAYTTLVYKTPFMAKAVNIGVGN